MTSLTELDSDQNIKTMQLNVKISDKSAEQINSKNRVREFGKNTGDTPNMSALNFAINSISTDISREKAELEKYRTIMGPQHPSIKEGEARLAQLQKMLDAEAARVQQQERQASEIYADSTKLLYEQLDTEKARSAQETVARNKLAGIAQKIGSLTLNYSEAYQTEQTETTSSLIESSNLTMLSPATPPTVSSLPNWGFIVSFAAVVGLCIGIGAATILERMDGRIHSPRVIQDKVNIPTLGIIHVQTTG